MNPVKNCKKCGAEMQWCQNSIDGTFFIRCSADYSHTRYSISEQDLRNYNMFTPNYDKSIGEWAYEKIHNDDD